MRVYKFRRWDKEKKAMYDLPILEAGDVWDEWIPEGKLMQWTGLVDNNGVDIYEGDIIFITDPDYMGGSLTHCLVEFHDGSFMYNRNHYGSNPNTFLSSIVGLKRCEVVGNIYENKELMKK